MGIVNNFYGSQEIRSLFNYALEDLLYFAKRNYTLRNE